MGKKQKKVSQKKMLSKNKALKTQSKVKKIKSKKESEELLQLLGGQRVGKVLRHALESAKNF